MSGWAPTKFKTTNWSAYNEALRQRGQLTIWFDPDPLCKAPPTGKRDRQPWFSDAGIQTCVTLNLLIDSTAIKAEGEGEWHAGKQGGSKRRIWRKADIGIDEAALEIRAIDVTGRNIGGAPDLPDLLDQIPADEEIGVVTADGAYNTRKCHEAIAVRGAAAVIPPRTNGDPRCRRNSTHAVWQGDPR
jgi:hypothetical protein